MGVNVLQPASTQCDVDPVCVSIELLSTYFNMPQPSVMLIQCVPIELLSTYFNLPQPSVMLIQCVPIELLSTYFNLPQPSVMLIQCVPIELLSTYFNLCHCSVMLIQCVSPLNYLQTSVMLIHPLRAIVNQPNPVCC